MPKRPVGRCNSRYVNGLRSIYRVSNDVTIVVLIRSQMGFVRQPIQN